MTEDEFIKNLPAFPQVDLRNSYGMLVPDRQPGMTLRDYFAAKAMQGMFDHWDENPNLEFQHIADCSYEMADAMLKARGQHG